MKVKTIFLLCALIWSMLSLCACNTMEGFGKDMKQLGQSVENAAAKKTGD